MVIIVGHRGAGKSAPENTLLAFRRAIRMGLERTELDVRLSKDKEVVVIHDADVGRVSDGKGKVHDLTLEELTKFNCPQRQKIPTLQEVIDVCKGKISLQIELKDAGTPPRFVSPLPSALYHLLLRNRMLNDVWVISFNPRLLGKMRALSRKVTCGYLYSTAPSQIWAIMKRHQFNYLCPRQDLVTKEFIAEAHAKGFKVYAWQANTRRVGEKLMQWGVDAIGTDVPEMFLKK